MLSANDWGSILDGPLDVSSSLTTTVGAIMCVKKAVGKDPPAFQKHSIAPGNIVIVKKGEKHLGMGQILRLSHLLPASKHDLCKVSDDHVRTATWLAGLKLDTLCRTKLGSVEVAFLDPHHGLFVARIPESEIHRRLLLVGPPAMLDAAQQVSFTCLPPPTR